MSAGATQAALLMLALDESAAAELLADLEPPEIEAIGSAMLGMKRVDPAQLAAAADEFLRIGDAQKTAPLNDSPGKLLARAVGEERAALVSERVAPADPAQRVASLQWFDAAGLAAAVGAEHPQFRAAVLAIAPPDLGIATLRKLDADAQADALRRIATMRSLSAEAFAEIERHLAAALTRTAARDSWPAGGTAAASRLLAGAGRAAQARILAELGDIDPELSRTLGENLFTFDDIAKLDAMALQPVLREVDADTLTAALKGCDDTTRDALLAGLSQRAASAIRDDIANGPPIRVADVQAAQKAVVGAARRLADSGAIDLGGDDE